MCVKNIEYALLPETLGKDETNKHGAPVDRLRSYFDVPIVTLQTVEDRQDSVAIRNRFFFPN